MVQHAGAVDVTLSWDANSEDDLEGYRIFMRADGHSYDYNTPAWDGAQTACTISDLDDGVTYHFVARAYNASAMESEDSEEVTRYAHGSPATLTTLCISGSDAVNENATSNYTATARYSDGNTQLVTSNCLWNADSAYASIDDNGVLTTLSVSGDQSVTIEATYTEGDIVETDQVSVTIVDAQPVLVSVSISGLEAVNENTSNHYTATATFSDSSTQNVTDSATWSTEGCNYADISTGGVLTTSEVNDDETVLLAATFTSAGVTKEGLKMVTIMDIPQSNLPPATPAISSPYDGEMACDTLLNITSEAFSDPDGDAHGQTHWQISKTPDFSSTVLDITTTADLTHLPVPHMILDGDTTYYVRVRFYDVYLEASSWSEVTEFTTAADSNDLNANGIPDDQEVGYGVDLDGNGVDDIDEPDNIKSVQSSDGSFKIAIAKESDNITAIEAVEIIDPSTIPETENSPETLTLGLVSYRIAVNEVGATAWVTIYFSLPIDQDLSCLKYDRINGWQDYSQYTTFNGDGRSMTLEVQDGGYGDSDGKANGVIVDPAGVGIPSGGGGSSSSNPLDALLKPVEAACFVVTAGTPPIGIPSGILVPFGLLAAACLACILKKKGGN